MGPLIESLSHAIEVVDDAIKQARAHEGCGILLMELAELQARLRQAKRRALAIVADSDAKRAS